MIDFGTDKKSYLTAFLQNVNWQVVADRLEEATRRARAA
jgi:superoxide dismutase